MPKLKPPKQYHIYTSRHNPGAADLLGEVAVKHRLQLKAQPWEGRRPEQPMIKAQTLVRAGTSISFRKLTGKERKNSLDRDGKRKLQRRCTKALVRYANRKMLSPKQPFDDDPLIISERREDLPKCRAFLVYLTARTWTDPDGYSKLFAEEMMEAMREDIPLILAHEMTSCMAEEHGGLSRAGCEFAAFFAHPDGSTPPELLRMNPYQTIAVPMRVGPWRDVSLKMLLMKIVEDSSKEPFRNWLRNLPIQARLVMERVQDTVQQMPGAVQSALERANSFARSSLRSSTSGRDSDASRRSSLFDRTLSFMGMSHRDSTDSEAESRARGSSLFDRTFSFMGRSHNKDSNAEASPPTSPCSSRTNSFRLVLPSLFKSPNGRSFSRPFSPRVFYVDAHLSPLRLRRRSRSAGPKTTLSADALKAIASVSTSDVKVTTEGSVHELSESDEDEGSLSESDLTSLSASEYGDVTGMRLFLASAGLVNYHGAFVAAGFTNAQDIIDMPSPRLQQIIQRQCGMAKHDQAMLMKHLRRTGVWPTPQFDSRVTDVSAIPSSSNTAFDDDSPFTASQIGSTPSAATATVEVQSEQQTRPRHFCRSRSVGDMDTMQGRRCASDRERPMLGNVWSHTRADAPAPIPAADAPAPIPAAFRSQHAWLRNREAVSANDLALGTARRRVQSFALARARSRQREVPPIDIGVNADSDLAMQTPRLSDVDSHRSLTVLTPEDSLPRGEHDDDGRLGV